MIAKTQALIQILIIKIVLIEIVRCDHNTTTILERQVGIETKECTTDKECENNRICNDGNYLKCQEYECNSSSKKCAPCLDELGEICTDCCNNDLDCVDGYCTFCESSSACRGTSLVFATASQIALSIAMLLGIMILISLLYRVCTKGHHPSTRRRGSGNQPNNNLTFANGARISVSSIQVRVLSRLQNRPPRYETQHDYEHRQREIDNEVRNEAIVNIYNTNNNLLDEPPTYDGSQIENNNTLPPPYSTAIFTVTDCSINNGISNNGFIHDNDECRTETVTTVNSLSNKNNKIIGKLNDKILHF